MLDFLFLCICAHIDILAHYSSMNSSRFFISDSSKLMTKLKILKCTKDGMGICNVCYFQGRVSCDDVVG